MSQLENLNAYRKFLLATTETEHKAAASEYRALTNHYPPTCEASLLLSQFMGELPAIDPMAISAQQAVSTLIEYSKA